MFALPLFLWIKCHSLGKIILQGSCGTSNTIHTYAITSSLRRSNLPTHFCLTHLSSTPLWVFLYLPLPQLSSFHLIISHLTITNTLLPTSSHPTVYPIFLPTYITSSPPQLPECFASYLRREKRITPTGNANDTHENSIISSCAPQSNILRDRDTLLKSRCAEENTEVAIGMDAINHYKKYHH